MVSRTLPDGPELPMDSTRVGELVRAALAAAVRDLHGTDVSGRERLVFRPGDGNAIWTTDYLPAPSYRQPAVWARIHETWKSPESDALTEYLWSHGASRMVLSQDGDGIPTREAWERFVWGTFIHGPLLALLPRVATEDLVRRGKYEPWRIDEQVLADASLDIADGACNCARTVFALYPTNGLQMPMEEILSIGPDTRLIPWTSEARCLFLTRYHDQYLSDDIDNIATTPPWANAVIEIKMRIKGLVDDNATTAIASAIDRLKWSLQTAANRDAPIEEGPVILFSPSGWQGPTLRRGSPPRGSRSIPTIEVTPDIALVASTLMQDLEEARLAAAEIDGAIWLFGRACNASLPRDALLDAVIGLEMILVPGPGEARYRFSLHGIALLGDEPAEVLDGELKKIYGMRSEAAHGAANDPTAFAAISPRSRFLLGKAIRSIVTLLKRGDLDVQSTKGDIGKAVERLVRKRLATSG